MFKALIDGISSLSSSDRSKFHHCPVGRQMKECLKNAVIYMAFEMYNLDLRNYERGGEPFFFKIKALFALLSNYYELNWILKC